MTEGVTRQQARDAADDHVAYMTSAHLVNDPEQHQAQEYQLPSGRWSARCSCGWTY